LIFLGQALVDIKKDLQKKKEYSIQEKTPYKKNISRYKVLILKN
jgi:hypothetical protein